VVAVSLKKKVIALPRHFPEINRIIPGVWPL